MQNTNIERRKFLQTASAATLTLGGGLIRATPVSAAQATTKKTRQWIDTHNHVSDIGSDGKKRENMLADLLDVLDRSEADLRMAISCDTVYMGLMRDDPAYMFKANKMVYDLCKEAPDRLFGSCLINPVYTEEALRVMKICFEEWGFVQLGEMMTYTHHYKMADTCGEKVVQAATKYNMPIQVHIGTYWHRRAGAAGDGMNQLGDTIAVAERVPDAKFILGHAIGCGPTSDYVSYANMVLDTLEGYFKEYPDNFWVEIRDFNSPALARALRVIPTNRILAGMDWTTRIGPPFQNYGTMFELTQETNPFPPEVASLVEFLRKAGARDSDIDRIGSLNAHELYKLPT